MASNRWSSQWCRNKEQETKGQWLVSSAYVLFIDREDSLNTTQIADALTLKAALVRNIDWEQANVQYTIDPSPSLYISREDSSVTAIR